MYSKQWVTVRKGIYNIVYISYICSYRFYVISSHFFIFLFYRLEYVCLIFKELVFSRPLSLCYVSLLHFVMIFSKCSVFIPKLCKSSRKYIVNKILIIIFVIIIYNYIYIYIYIYVYNFDIYIYIYVYNFDVNYSNRFNSDKNVERRIAFYTRYIILFQNNYLKNIYSMFMIYLFT